MPLEDRAMLSTFGLFPYGGFAGGVRVASADVQGSGITVLAWARVNDSSPRGSSSVTAETPQTAIVGMLLPAVQKVREAAVRSPVGQIVRKDYFAVGSDANIPSREDSLTAETPEAAIVGMLLPAVQQVRANAAPSPFEVHNWHGTHAAGTVGGAQSSRVNYDKLTLEIWTN